MPSVYRSLVGFRAYGPGLVRDVAAGEEIPLDGLESWIVRTNAQRFERVGARRGYYRVLRAFAIRTPRVATTGARRGDLLRLGDPRVELLGEAAGDYLHELKRAEWPREEPRS
jgi:hypothetical protein